MYLKKLELQGFKSFANKTTLEFPDGNTITGIVGPNGSGKSCVADAIRWVLGEQSLSLLRAKRSTEVIFSGSEKKTKSGFTEVSIQLDNNDKRAKIDYTEVVITRRLYRNGENEFYLNKNKVKLQDILLLLAQSNFGQKTYSVIGQGMIESVLLQNPRERKDFFDEAAGIKQFQLKRKVSINKLRATEENLKQAEILLLEIRPRLKTLSRHVNKLEQYDEIKNELHSMEHIYYGALWHKINNEYTEEKNKIEHEQIILEKLKMNVASLQKEFENQEKGETVSDELLDMQTKYNNLINKKNTLREKEFINREKITNFKLKQAPDTKISSEQILKEMEDIINLYEKITLSINNKTNIESLKKELQDSLVKLKSLSQKIKSPIPTTEPHKELEEALKLIHKDIQNIDEEINKIQNQITSTGQKNKSEQANFFALQKKWRDKIEEKNILENKINEFKINLARVETKKEALEIEMENHLKERKERILSYPAPENQNVESLENKIQNLRYQIELIGSIDPETVKEYKETKERYDFLESQATDLSQASQKLKEIIKKLDMQTKEYFDKAFQKINNDFIKFFQILFKGGKARLEIIETEKIKQAETEEIEQEDIQETKDELENVTGIEIFANPPGKKVNAINMLSGGEKALVSIALVSAIISNNPSPFVVLDEVDAALDESNSIRFSEIIKLLADKTQFILITHNRATMSMASVLYGVSMGDDGTSQLLSLKLKKEEKFVNK